jgi:hypothetical protein
MRALIDRNSGAMKNAILAATAALALLGATGCGTQAPVACTFVTSGRGGYFVHLTHTGTSAGCPANIGDIWAFDPYFGSQIIAKPLSFDWPNDPGPVTSGPNPYGYGKVPAEPDSSSLCTVSSLTTMTSPDGTHSYDVTNLVFYGRADVLGAVWKADVRVVSPACPGGDTYTAEGMAPILTILGTPLTCGGTLNSPPDTNPSDFCATPDSEIAPPLAATCNTDQWAQDIAPLANSVVGGTDVPGQGVCFLAKPFPSLK